MLDTSPDAAKVQAEVHRRLSGSRKISIACEMIEAARELARARIRARYPHFDEAAVHDQLTWELYGVRRQR